MMPLLRLVFIAFGLWIAWRLIRSARSTQGSGATGSSPLVRAMTLGLGIWVTYRILLNVRALALPDMLIVGAIALTIGWLLRRPKVTPDPDSPPPTSDERIGSARIRIEGMIAQCSGRLEQLQTIAENQRGHVSSESDSDSQEVAQLNLDRTMEQVAEWTGHLASLQRLKTRFDATAPNLSSPVWEKVVGLIAQLEDLPGSIAEIQRISEQLDPSGSDVDPARE
jgi:hypothetical protein